MRLKPTADWPKPGRKVVLVAAAVLGVYVCDKSAKDWDLHDHGAIVWDELVGMGIALIALPMSLGAAVLAFAMFRLFDTWKPWPVNILDKELASGFGIMADDMAAGVLAAIASYLVWSLIAKLCGDLESGFEKMLFRKRTFDIKI